MKYFLCVLILSKFCHDNLIRVWQILKILQIVFEHNDNSVTRLSVAPWVVSHEHHFERRGRAYSFSLEVLLFFVLIVAVVGK